MATAAAPQTTRRSESATPTTPQPEKTGRRKVLRSVNPYSGEVMKTYPEMQPEEVDQAIAKAHERFRTWRAMSF